MSYTDYNKTIYGTFKFIKRLTYLKILSNYARQRFEQTNRCLFMSA